MNSRPIERPGARSQLWGAVRRVSAAMPLRETEAIALRTHRLDEADKIVSVFARALGRLRAVAAGQTRFLGSSGVLTRSMVRPPQSIPLAWKTTRYRLP